MIVELIGGPLDGEKREVSESVAHRYRIFRHADYCATLDETQPTVPIQYGVYAPRTSAPGYVPVDLYWLGWHE